MMSESVVNGVRATWIRAMPGPAPDDPVVPMLMNDNAEIARIGPDVEQIRCALKRQCCMASFVPCCVPILLGCMIPCKIWYGSTESFDQYAQGRRLILYEKSLVYQLESTALVSPNVTICCSDQMVDYSLNISFLFDDDIQIYKNQVSGCGYAVPVLVISLGGKPIAVLDAPKDVDTFLEQFQAQVAAASSKPSNDISPLFKEIHRATLEYYKFLMETRPTMVVRRGSDTTTVIDEAQVQFQARMFYDNLTMKISLLRDRIPGHMPSASDAPLVAEMVRDEVPRMSIALLTSKEVQGVLAELGLQIYSANFEKAGVDGGMLSVMDDSGLVELGISSSLDRKRILGWIANQKALSNPYPGGSLVSHGLQ